MDAPEVGVDGESHPIHDGLGGSPATANVETAVPQNYESADGRNTIVKKKRFRRKRSRPRKRTLAMKRISVAGLREAAGVLSREGVELDYDRSERPQTRAECPDYRPCPWVSCKHSLYLDVNPETGAITFNFPELEPHEMPPDRCCSLDLADAGAHTLDDTGVLINLTRERIRQVEVKMLMKLKVLMPGLGIDVAPASASSEPQSDSELNYI